MTETKTEQYPSTMRPGDAPKSLWVGLIVGVVTFVVRVSFSSTSTVNGAMQTCTYIDAGALVGAVVCLICAVIAVRARITRPGAFPFTGWLVYLLSAVVVVLAVIHTLRGLGMIGGIC